MITKKNKGKVNYLIILSLFIFSVLILNIANISAFDESDILKPAKLNESYTIFQTCATCTFVEVTISNVDGIIISNQRMTNNGSGNWIYNLTPNITSRHDITGLGDIDGINRSFVTFFPVTPSGRVASEGDARLYTLFTTILFIIILGLGFLVTIMPSKNEKDSEGFEGRIIRHKYMRVFLIGLMYGLTILLLNFLNGLAQNFTALDMFAGVLGFLFLTMMRLSWPFTVILMFWILVMLVHDTNVSKNLKKIERFKI